MPIAEVIVHVLEALISALIASSYFVQFDYYSYYRQDIDEAQTSEWLTTDTSKEEYKN
jgi:hypothetical protein